MVNAAPRMPLQILRDDLRPVLRPVFMPAMTSIAMPLRMRKNTYALNNSDPSYRLLTGQHLTRKRVLGRSGSIISADFRSRGCPGTPTARRPGAAAPRGDEGP